MEKTNGHQETEKQNINVKLVNMGTVNKNKVVLNVNSRGTLTLFFSYQTIVGFILQTPTTFKEETIKNYWSTTTGKLLNELQPEHNKRLDEDTFKTELAKAFNSLYVGCRE